LLSQSRQPAKAGDNQGNSLQLGAGWQNHKIVAFYKLLGISTPPTMRRVLILLILVFLTAFAYAAEPCTSQYLTPEMRDNCLYSEVVHYGGDNSLCNDIVDGEIKAECQAHAAAVEPVRQTAGEAGQEAAGVAGGIQDTFGSLGLIVAIVVGIVIILFVLGKLKNLWGGNKSQEIIIKVEK